MVAYTRNQNQGDWGRRGMSWDKPWSHSIIVSKTNNDGEGKNKIKKLNRKSAVCSYNRTFHSSKIRKQITKLIPSHRSQIPLK